MGNEFILTVGSIRKIVGYLVDDGLKTCFNPSDYKRTKSFGFSMFLE